MSNKSNNQSNADNELIKEAGMFIKSTFEIPSFEGMIACYVEGAGRAEQKDNWISVSKDPSEFGTYWIRFGGIHKYTGLAHYNHFREWRNIDDDGRIYPHEWNTSRDLNSQPK